MKDHRYQTKKSYCRAGRCHIVEEETDIRARQAMSFTSQHPPGPVTWGCPFPFWLPDSPLEEFLNKLLSQLPFLSDPS